MYLGLGLGLNPRGGEAGATADWAAWDGSNDGTNKLLFTANGLTRAQDIAAVSDEEAVIIWRDGTTTGDPAKMVVLDVDSATKQFKAETTNTSITLTNELPLSMELISMGNDRYLATYEGADGGASLPVVALVQKSGKTLTVLDEISSITGITTANFRKATAKLNSTQAVMVMRDDGDSFNGKLVVIDITGDTISTGTTVTVGFISQYPAITRLTDSSFFYGVHGNNAVLNSEVGYCTVSGTTITVVDAKEADANSCQDMMMERIDDNTAVLLYEFPAPQPGTVNAVVVSWSGSAVTFGTPVAGVFGAGDINGFPATSTALGNRQAMFASTLRDSTPFGLGAARVITVDESNNLTLDNLVTFNATQNLDHVTIDVTPSGLYVFMASQNENTTPDQQMETRIIQVF